MITLYRNGFIIKSYEERPRENDESYFGIGRYMTWPLDVMQDSVSRNLVEEALERWFCGWDRLMAVPELDYIKRYIAHCNELNIPTFCLQIESPSLIITTTEEVMVDEVLGFDYADIDMATSCLYDDLLTPDPYIQQAFRVIKERLNSNGLIKSTQDMQTYFDVRNKLIAQGYSDMDVTQEYYAPTIVRVSRITLA